MASRFSPGVLGGVPLHKEGRVVGVLDIDSPLFGRFSEEDKTGLEEFAGILEKAL